MKHKSHLNNLLIDAVKEALNTPGTGKQVRPKVDVKALRQQLHLTQRQFALHYHLALETIRNWEQHKRSPDATGIAFLTCIAKNPRVIHDLLND